MAEKWRETIWENEKLREVIEYFNGYGSPYDELIIELVEKEISKKVLKSKGQIIVNQYKCPNCKRQWSGSKWGYCHECGQKLYWEGDNYGR
ncbi:hypothetical protein [Wansuia hejianensis]|uniref:Uncharacterized protein n=1 Tax=Wansuia hejianensis TaxID=2763667 RepID=A0A926EVH1_9FIRM|nr:hypothetical protein [Wansuia hejianensis]MBC8590628.1 hypothetical protein [Wansuia hejianensis]